jgi:hypothetical protein
MLIGANLTRLSPKSLVQIQAITRDSVESAVRTSGENMWIRGMVDELRESSDPLEMVVELAETDPDCLRPLLRTCLFVFEQLYEIQRQQAEIERGAVLN